MIKRGVKDIERTVAEGPIIRFESGETAYKYLKHILESRRKEIVEIHSTAIQQRGTLLDAYRDYFAFLYRQFYSDKTENRPALKSIVSFDPLSDLTAESKFLFEICFKSLFGKRGRNPITGDGGIEFWFVPADLFVPFVNFTLIKFDDGSCESVWGWYVDQSDRLGENDADLNKLLEEEVFARSHSVTMYQGFKSIFDLVRYNWEKPMGEMASPKIQIGFGTTETTIQQHLQTIVKKASSLVDKMKEDATHA
jgi:hypothetical protein